jgi:cysteinyl-tRNA synthetase
MIAMIETLIAKGNAYVAHGAEGQEVLFDTASMAILWRAVEAQPG